VDAVGGREVVAGGGGFGFWVVVGGGGSSGEDSAGAGREAGRARGIVEEGSLDSVVARWFGFAGSGRKDWLVEIRGSVHLLCEMHPGAF
jgi:hypothetical protein